MATTKGAIVTLLDAEPRERLERGTINAKSRIFRDTAAVADGDFDADGDVVYLLKCQVILKSYLSKLLMMT